MEVTIKMLRESAEKLTKEVKFDLAFFDKYKGFDYWDDEPWDLIAGLFLDRLNAVIAKEMKKTAK